MNTVCLIGRLTKDPEMKGTETKVAHYALAIDRIGEGTDYPQIAAFGKSAEFASKYFKKGMRVGVQGRIQTGSYTNKEGQKVYTTQVVANRQFFADGKAEGRPEASDDGFVDVPEGIDEELPFN